MKVLLALGASIAAPVGLWVHVGIGVPELGFYPWFGSDSWAAFLGAATCFGSSGKSVLFVSVSRGTGLALGYASEYFGKKPVRPA